SPAESALAQLADLRLQLAESSEITATIDLVQRASAIREMVNVARLRGEVAFQAAETHLRAQRCAGLMLVQLLDSMPLRPRNAPRRGTVPWAVGKRQYLPNPTLSSLGISGHDASYWMRIARLPDGEFEERIAAALAAGKLPSTTSFARAARRFARGRSSSKST